ncbi:hypothetical protein ACJZ2D_016927 [Fusarium nematophilum]
MATAVLDGEVSTARHSFAALPYQVPLKDPCLGPLSNTAPRPAQDVHGDTLRAANATNNDHAVWANYQASKWPPYFDGTFFVQARHPSHPSRPTAHIFPSSIDPGTTSNAEPRRQIRRFRKGFSPFFPSTHHPKAAEEALPSHGRRQWSGPPGRHLSADNVSPNAVVQVQAIGSCFQSNGPWAAKLPDLLCRTSCVRLERLSTWIGWMKDDTSSFMSQTPGGRTAALLCCALGSLYSKARCGMILFDLSRDILPSERQASSPSQLGDVCVVLESKLGCLGFGNHLALHLTRLRQCFFEAELEVPRDLADTPTEEDMHVFLNAVRDALGDESLVLQFSGTKCAGTLLALVLAMCPEDVSVQVNGEIIMRGRRDNILFSIANTRSLAAEIHLGTSHIDIVLAMEGAEQAESLKLAAANLIASTAISFTGDDFHDTIYVPSSQKFPAQGLRAVLGPAYEQTIQERLQRVLCRPSGTLQTPSSEFKTLQNTILMALPLSRCTCGVCRTGEPLDILQRLKRNSKVHEAQISCPVYRLWLAIGHITHVALLMLFVQASPNSSVRFQTKGYDQYTGKDRRGFIWKAFHLGFKSYELWPVQLHNQILDLAGRWKKMSFGDEPPRICSSSSASTIYPSTLETPRILNPWAVQYELVDGRLHYRSDCYDSIITAMPDEVGSGKLTKWTTKESIAKGRIAAPSRLGEHNSLLMTLRPALMEGSQALLLRCQINQANNTIDVDFRDIHLGLLSLTPGEACEHDLAAPLTLSDSARRPVIATSVISPAAPSLDVIALTLTHRNEESQFLCCSQHDTQLYQGDCCMPCAVAQAEREGYSVVIGGSPSTYYIMHAGTTGQGSD